MKRYDIIGEYLPEGMGEVGDGDYYKAEDVAPLIEENRWRNADEEKPPASSYIVVPLLVFCEEINTKRPLIGWVENDLWHIEHKVGKYRVTLWRPLPKLPEMK